MTCIANQDLGFWQRHRLFSFRARYEKWVGHQNNDRWADGLPPLTYAEKIHYIRQLYKEALKVFISPRDDLSWMSFEDFSAYICHVKELSPVFVLSRRYDRSSGTYRNGDSYRKSPDHEKKELSKKEGKTEAWRKHKQLEKDKSKSGRRWRRVRKFWVRQSAKDHRQWVRNNLAHENYDAFGDHEYKMFVDPWVYD